MKKRIAVRMILAIALLLASAGWSLALEEKRMYEAMRVEVAPTVDGRLDEECWQKAPQTSSFTRVIQGPEEIQQTFFQVVYTDTDVYFGITLLEKNIDMIKATVRVDDTSSIMGDDAVEIFIQPDTNDNTYYQFAANTLGTRYDAVGFNPAWNADWDAAATIGEDAWYMEVRISFAAFGDRPLAGSVWGLNVCRDRVAGGDEWSSWSPSPSGFHAPDRFGRLIFSGSATGRVLLLECAEHARHSIALEKRLSGALDDITTAQDQGGETSTDEKTRARIANAQAALAKLNEMIAANGLLDLQGWMAANKRLAEALEDVEELAWQVRFDRLLAED